MLALVNALRPSEDTMMKYLMLASTVLAINSQLLVLMVLLESIMSLLELAYPCSKVMKMKSPKFHSTLRAIKSLQLVVIRLAVSGQ